MKLSLLLILTAFVLFAFADPFGYQVNKPAKKRKYGIEIDGKYFFVIQTDADLQNLCTFINI